MQLLIENLGISKRILGKSALMCYNKTVYASKETARYERLNYNYGNELR